MDADSVGKQSDHDHSDHFIGLLVDNAILKAQVSLQRETLNKHLYITPERTTSTSSSSTSGVSLSSASSDSISFPHSSPSTSSLLQAPPTQATYQTQAVQTDPTAERHKENYSDFLQQKLEAVTLSNELLTTSLDGARRHIASLEATIASLNEELKGKEAQITAVSGRIGTLLRSYESTQSDSLQYKHLYHRSVLQCNTHQAQIEQFWRLLPKLEQVNKLKVVAVDQLMKNKTLLVQWQSSLESSQQKIFELKSTKAQLNEVSKECQVLRESNINLTKCCDGLQRSLAHHMACLSATAALRTMHAEEVSELKISLKAQRTEVVALKAKMVQLMDAFQRSREEYNENTEFTETERMMLMEANVDLEAQVDSLKSSLEEKEKSLKDTKQQLQRSRTKAAETARWLDEAKREADQFATQQSLETRDLLKCVSSPLNELLKTLEQHTGEKPCSPPPISSSPIDIKQTKEHLSFLVSQLTSSMTSFLSQRDSMSTVKKTSDGVTSCADCSILKSQLLQAVGILNGRSALQYGDMMQEKFSLETQVKELSSELEKGEREFEKLSQYIKEYKAKTTEKIDILKSNMSKADGEIEELDRLLEHTRQVLQENQPHIATCKALLDLLQELEGGDEVSANTQDTRD